MSEQEKTRHGGRANEDNIRNSGPFGAPEQARLPTPTAIKREVNPELYYQSTLPNAPKLRFNTSGWSKNFRCPFPDHDDRNGSFGVNRETGAYKCNGCSHSGGSIIDHRMAVDGLTLDGARAWFRDNYHIEPGDTRSTPPPAPKAPRANPPAALTPIPAAADATRPLIHPKWGEPTAIYPYRGFYVYRFDPKGQRKLYNPLTWNPDRGWEWKAPPEPRPLYHDDRLTARPDAPTLIAEGEKAADAAAALLPDLVATTTMNGAQSPAKSDFSPVAGRHVRIWPDADPPGATYAATVADLCYAAGARTVEILELASVAIDPGTGAPRELPRGWDAADAAANGWTPEALDRAARWVPVPRPDVAPAPAPAPAAELPAGWSRRDSGMFYVPPGGKPEDAAWIAPPCRIVAVVRDERGDDFGRLIEWNDLDGQPRRLAIMDSERQVSGDVVRARLAALGYEVGNRPEQRRLFSDLLRRCTPPARARTTTRTGWFGSAYVLPNGEIIGDEPEPIVLLTEGERPPCATRGSVADWRNSVARLAAGNSRLVFGIACAFAGPLLVPLNAEGGGFHLKGSSTNASSTGKTTCQRVAASVIGPPAFMQRWRTTDNALEGVAELHNDSLLILDELAQIDPKAAGESAYLLANGAGKNRLDRNSAGRPVKRWQLIFLSSGEIGLAEHLASIQRKKRAGQDVRMIEIPADDGGGCGVFSQLHGFPNGAAFAAALTSAAASSYGTPFREYIRFLTANRESIAAEAAAARDDFLSFAIHPSATINGQVRRVAQRFGLVAVAGELATAAGITGWHEGSARDAVLKCFRDWLTDRGGNGSNEERELIGQVRLFIENHGNRFRWRDRMGDDHAPEVMRQVGVKFDDPKHGIVYAAFSESFRAEILAGYHPVESIEILTRNGILLRDKSGAASHKIRIPGFTNPRRVFILTDGSEPE